ncbi:hypothetical protein BV25DRAFT_1778203, partial [Artomyces pyxidatus]
LMDPQPTSQPPSKRRRQEVEIESYQNNTPPPKFIKSEDFWLEDGNIILSCDPVRFRVHRGILALHSIVFKDLFATSGVGDDTFEGVPIVTLHDRAKDMRLLLQMIHFRIYCQNKSKMRLETLRRVLRMARKYIVDKVYKEIVNYLKFIFPSTLHEH